MSLETDIKEKYALLEKLKAEISRLNDMKTQLARDINVPFLEAKARADEVLAQAQAKADEISTAATAIKTDAEAYSTRMTTEADNMFAKANERETEVNDGKGQLDLLIDDFKVQKASFDENIGRIREEAESILAQAKEQKIKAEILLAEANSRIAEAVNKEERLAIATAESNHKRELFDRDRQSSKEERRQVEEAKTLLVEQHAANQKLLADMKAQQEQINKATAEQQALVAKVEAKNAKLDERVKMLDGQFAVLEKSNQGLEEKRKTIDAQIQLLALRDREVSAKIITLEELRKKAGVS